MAATTPTTPRRERPSYADQLAESFLSLTTPAAAPPPTPAAREVVLCGAILGDLAVILRALPTVGIATAFVVSCLPTVVDALAQSRAAVDRFANPRPQHRGAAAPDRAAVDALYGAAPELVTACVTASTFVHTALDVLGRADALLSESRENVAAHRQAHGLRVLAPRAYLAACDPRAAASASAGRAAGEEPPSPPPAAGAPPRPDGGPTGEPPPSSPTRAVRPSVSFDDLEANGAAVCLGATEEAKLLLAPRANAVRHLGDRLTALETLWRDAVRALAFVQLNAPRIETACAEARALVGRVADAIDAASGPTAPDPIAVVDFLSGRRFGETEDDAPAVAEVLANKKTLGEAADCLRLFAVDLVAAAARSRALHTALEASGAVGCGCGPGRRRRAKERGARRSKKRL